MLALFMLLDYWEKYNSFQVKVQSALDSDTNQTFWMQILFPQLCILEKVYLTSQCSISTSVTWKLFLIELLRELNYMIHANTITRPGTSLVINSTPS